MPAPARQQIDTITLCAYCGTRRAVNRDHVVPKSLYRWRLEHSRAYVVGKCPCAAHELPAELMATVPACFECNLRKGTRKLVPPSWTDKIPALKEVIPGPWRVWDGNPMSPVYREVHP